MTEDTTVVERLERLAGIIEEHERGLLEGTEDLALDEVKHGVRNAARDLQEVVDDDVRDCTHCGSPFTFRRADGDVACKDCPGIMPETGIGDISGGQCPDCDGQLKMESPNFHDKAKMKETLICEGCDAAFVQRWRHVVTERVGEAGYKA